MSLTDTAGQVSTAGTVVTVGVAGNLVTNSTFETDLSGWAALAGCGLTRVAAGHIEGWAANLNNPTVAAISLVAAGSFSLAPLVTERFGLASAGAAFGSAAKRNGLKVVVEPAA